MGALGTALRLLFTTDLHHISAVLERTLVFAFETCFGAEKLKCGWTTSQFIEHKS